MKLFLTGGTGFIGSGVLRELLAKGHEVEALARSDASEKALADAGASVRRGDLTDLDALEAAAAKADGALHLAFGHDFSDFERMGRNDLNAIEALARGLAAAGPGKVLVAASGTALAEPGARATEDAPPSPRSPAAVRLASERAVVAAAGQGVRSAVLRLAPCVHGPGDRGGFVPMMMRLARQSGVSAYLGDGENVWPAVYRDDAARLFALAAEKLADGSVPPGSRLHAVAEEGVPVRQLAAAIAEQLGLGAPQSRESEHFGPMALFAGIDNPAGSEKTRAWTGWRPTGPSLLEDVRGAAYADAGT